MAEKSWRCTLCGKVVKSIYPPNPIDEETGKYGKCKPFQSGTTPPSHNWIYDGEK